MTDDLELPPAVIERLAGWTIKPAGRSGVLALNSGHYFADGDGVSVLLRISEGDALVSDGGTMITRLADAGVDVTNDRAKQAWEATLRDFGLAEIDKRVVGRKPAAAVVSLLVDLVDAMLTLDGLKVLAKQRQVSRLERQLYSFLQDSVRLPFKQHPTVKMPHGASVRPTALVHAPNREVYVQTASKDTSAISRASFVTGVLRRANVAMDQRLVVLKGTRADWEADYVDLLEDNARVGFMDSPSELNRLLTEV